jgi:AraC-like DNA-binding protein
MSTPVNGTAVAPPAPALRPYIVHYAGFFATGLSPGVHSGLPSRHMHLIIGLGEGLDGLIDVLRMPNGRQGPGRFQALVSGLQDGPAMVRHNGTLHGLHVFLTPLGARAIFGASAPELARGVFDLSDLWGSAADRLVSRLKAARTWRERFAILDDEFGRVLVPFDARRDVMWAWGRLLAVHGAIPIHGLARELGWSRRHFGERFQTEFGVAPKTAARIFRFERACRMIMDERPGLADAAAACGYHDQAHMTHEWNALAGCTPATWIARELPIVQDYELAGRDHGN